jgi:Zn-dependent protease
VDGKAASIGRILVLNLVTMLISLTIHEFSHAVVADKLGDDTPRRQGRLTLSPLEHYDVWGTLLIPTIAILVGGGMSFIGWAKPVETNPQRYTRRISMRNGHRLVAVAGPLSNLVLAVISMALLALLVKFEPAALRHGSGLVGSAAVLLSALVAVNLGLFVFNLLPLPPFDGSRLLPRSMDDFQRAVAPYSFFIVLVILNIAQLRNLLFFPVIVLLQLLQTVFGTPLVFS